MLKGPKSAGLNRVKKFHFLWTTSFLCDIYSGIARKLISVIDSLTPVELCVCVSSSGFTIDVIFNFDNLTTFVIAPLCSLILLFMECLIDIVATISHMR